MAVHNADIAEVFARIADLPEILANPFRVRAYGNPQPTLQFTQVFAVEYQKTPCHLEVVRPN